MSPPRRRSLHLTPELLRLYSRRGNYHSSTDAAAEIGYTKLVAQGMQVAAPAYGLLLDGWGNDLLAHGTITLKFVGIVTDGESAEAEVTVDGDTASFAVSSGDRTVVVGTATRGSR